MINTSWFKKIKRGIVLVLCIAMITSVLPAYGTEAGRLSSAPADNSKKIDSAAENIDWSEYKDLTYVLSDIEQKENLNAVMNLDILFRQLGDGEKISAGDKLSFKIEDRLFNVQDTGKDSVKIYYGDIKDIDDKKTKLEETEVAEYRIKENQLEVTFLDSVEKIEDMTSVFLRVKIPVEYKESVLGEKSGEAQWKIRDAGDESEEIILYVPLPAKGEVLKSEPAEKNTEENSDSSMKIKSGDEEAIGSIPFGDGRAQVLFTKKDYQEITQQIWWVDNNQTENRYSTDKYKQLFCGRDGGEDVGRGSLTAEFTITKGNGKGDVRKIEFDVKTLIDSGLLSVDDIIVVPYQGGYKLSVKDNVLPSKGYYYEENIGEGTPEMVEGEFAWTVNPPKRLNVDDGTNNDIENYYFVNVSEPEDFTDMPIEPGWYYIKNHTFTIDVQIRHGDTENINHDALQEKLNEQLHFYYKMNGKDSDADYEKISLKELLGDKNHDTGIEWEEIQADGIFDTYRLSIKNLPLYRVDGLENIYYVMNDNGDDDRDNTIIDLGIMEGGEPTYEKGGDYLKITYENDPVGNFGSVTDKTHNGGTVIMTLMGQKTYAGTKVWLDEADDKNRPEIEFRLWRYTKKDKADGTPYSYKDASPVKNAKGEIVQINIPKESKDDEIKLSFYEKGIKDSKGNTGMASPGLGYLDDGRLEYLPKYDSEGYEYIYFAREDMKNGGKYEQIFGEVKQNSDGTFEVSDKLPNGVEVRENTDKSIYNDGTVSNRLDANISIEVEKRWEAAAFQDSFGDVKVEVKLQSAPVGTTNWTDVTEPDDNGNLKPVTKIIDNFEAEHLTQSVSHTSNKYDLMGRHLAYRWIETAIYQGENGNEKKIEIGKDHTFALTQGGRQVKYESAAELVDEDEDSEKQKSRIVNRLKDTVNYVIKKEWTGGLTGEGEKIYVRVQQKDYQGKDNLILEHDGDTSKGFMMDGKADKEPSQMTGWCTDEKTSFKFTCQEVEPWTLEIKGLPKYSESGHIYDYMAFESTKSNSWIPSYATILDDDTNTYKTTITNSPPQGQGRYIYAQKEWIDDSDVEHRGPVTVTVYEYDKDAEGDKYRPYEDKDGNIYEAVLSTDNFWWSKINLDVGANDKELFIVETKVGDMDMHQAGEGGNSLYTQDNLKDIYEAQKNIKNESSAPIKYKGEFHYYSQHYKLKEVAGYDFYTVTNQRLGFIDLTVTKYWEDGNGKQREELKKELEDKGYKLYLRLSCDEYPDSVNYADGTVWLSEKVDPEPVKIVDNKNNKADALQEVQIDSQGTDEHKYYFHGLPKYDENGAVVHYTIEEVVLDKDLKKPEENADKTEKKAYDKAVKEAKTLNEMKGNYADKGKDEKKDKIYTEYTASVKASKYEVGELHTDDQQEWEVTNRLSGVKPVKFYKQWKDAYRNDMGQRPDIALDIYQLRHKESKAADGTALDMNWELSSYYKDYKWNKVENGGNSDVWEISLENLPKYDSHGYEIFYYGREVVTLNNSAAFDYIPVYYKHNAYTGDRTTVIGDEDGKNEDLSGDILDKIKVTSLKDTATGENSVAEALLKRDAMTAEGKPADDVHLLKENGTFVNQVEEDVLVEGKKLWRMGNNQLPDVEWPAVEFTLYQKNSEDGKVPENPDRGPGYQVDKDGNETGNLVDKNGNEVKDKEGNTLTYKEVAHVTIADWESVKKDNTYGFAMNFMDENKYIVENNAAKIIDKNGYYIDTVNGKDVIKDKNGKIVTDKSELKNIKTIPQYDSDGNMYYYEVREKITDKAADGSWENVYQQPEINTYMVSNIYKSVKGKLNVKKFMDAELDTGEKYPTVSFTLTRKYKSKETGKDVLDNGFSQTKVIKWNDFKDGTAETEFSNLDVYAPNGAKYKYIVTENENEFVGYTVYSEKGDIENKEDVKKSGAVVEGITLEDTSSSIAKYNVLSRAWNAVKNLVRGEDSDDKYQGAAAFRNEYEPGKVTLKGLKLWEDENNVGARPPFVEEDSDYIKFTVRRQAPKSDGGGIGLQDVAEDTYTITWEKHITTDKDGKVTDKEWAYTIAGKDDTDELEKYAPNGVEWKYDLKEVLAEPYKSYYRATGYIQQNSVNGDKITMNSVSNVMMRDITAIKEWKLKDQSGIVGQGNNSTLIGSDYADYEMAVDYHLQARVEHVYTANNGEKETRSEWMNVEDLFEKFGYDYAALLPNKPSTKTTAKHTITAPEASRKVLFWGNIHAVKTDKSIPDLVSDITVEKGDIIQLKYRAVETEVRYYKKGNTTPIYTQKVALKDEAKTEDIPTYKLVGDSLDKQPFVEVIQEELSTGIETKHAVKNALPTVNLRIWKSFVDDQGYQTTARPNLKDGTSYVNFIIQRREISDTEKDWENVTRNGKDYTVDVSVGKNYVSSTGDDRFHAGQGTFYGLTRYDWNLDGKLIEYEYRARELAFDADLTDGVQEDEILEDSDYTSAYQVKYNDDIELVQEDTVKPTGNEIDYTVKAQNYFKKVDLYAEKDWKAQEDGDPEITVPVTLKVQYLKKGVENPDGTVSPAEWENMPDTEILLDADIDEPAQEGNKTYYKLYEEYAPWKAHWVLPERIDDAELTADGKVQYRVVEVTDNSYPVTGAGTGSTAFAGAGTEDNPYTFTFENTGDTAKDNPYKLTDAPTELKISKTVKGETTNDEFTFTIKAEDDSGETPYASYQRFKKKSGGSGYEKDSGLTAIDLSDGKKGNFVLGDDEYIIVYGLVKGAGYEISETGAESGSDADFDKYETTVTSSNVPSPERNLKSRKINITTPNTSPSGSENIPEVAFTNAADIVGSITVEKKNESNKPLEGVVFHMQWRRAGDQDASFENLTSAQCGNSEILKPAVINGKEYIGTVTTGKDGIAVFDKLLFPDGGVYEYKITEIKSADGYNILAEPVIQKLPYTINAENISPVQKAAKDYYKTDNNEYYYKDIKINISNNKSIVMPNTSGSGMFWPGIIGFTIIALCVVSYILKENRRKRGAYEK
ncbi:MAG: Cna B-type domain-containing protein [Anaerovoracaceae bacterium]